MADGEVRLVRPDDARPTRALHGLARALVANMVTGVTEGFRRELEIEGVGFRADVQGRKLNLQLGFSHPIAMEVPEGLSVSVEANTRIRIEGIDKARGPHNLSSAIRLFLLQHYRTQAQQRASARDAA